MKKLVLLFLLFFSFLFHSKAQLYNWTKTIGAAGVDRGQFVTVDESNGNVYVLGTFQNTIDVDPGVAVYHLTADSSAAFFIAKYTENGTLLWARMANGEIYCSGAQVTSTGDLIFVGSYYFNAVFIQPQAIFQLPYIHVESPFFARYTSSGDLVYVKNLGGYSNTSYRVAGFKLDNLDNIVLSISGSGELNLDVSGTNLIYFDQDFGIIKYDLNGNYLWSKGFGVWPAQLYGGNYAHSLDIDMYNNIYVVGQFKGSIDFSGGLGTGVLIGPGQNIMDYNHFMCKFDSFGNLIFAKNIADINYNGTPNLSGNGISIANSTVKVNESGSEIFVAIHLMDTFDINPNGSPVIFIPISEFDICLLKFDIAGNLIWNKQINSTNGDEHVIQMEMDLDGNIYLTGYYTGDIYFNPSSTIGSAISLNSNNLFIAKLNGNGNYLWEWKSEHGTGYSIYIDDCENLYGTGDFSNMVNFSPGPGIDNKNSMGSSDFYLLKYAKYHIQLSSYTNPTGCGLQDGTITLSGFTPNATYNIYATHNGLPFSVLNLLADSSGVIQVIGLGEGIYAQIFTIINGCKFYCNQDVNLVSPVFNASLSNQLQPTFCTATDGSISFVGFNPSLQYVVQYYFNGTNFISQNVFSDNNGIILLNNLSLGTYSNFGFEALGCSSAVSDTITLATSNIGNNILLTASNPTICNTSNGAITINGLLPNANYNISYEYNGAVISTILSSNNNGSILISALDTGNYSNIQIGIPACSFTTINNFNIVNPPAPAIPSVGNHVSFCSNNLGAITAPAGSSGVINWYGDSTLTNQLASGLSFNPPTLFGQNTYYVTETLNGCESLPASVLVTINEMPSVSNAGDSLTTCLTQIQLAANLPQVGTGNWSVIYGGAIVLNAGDPTSSVNLGNGLNVLNWNITNGVCPVSTSQIKINVVAMEVSTNILSNDNCGKGNGKVALSQTGGVAPINYEWTSIGLSGDLQSNLLSADYTVVATDIQGCVSSILFHLPSENSANIALGTDKLIYAGDSVFFNLQTQGSYVWSPDSTLSCNNCHDPIAFPKVTTTYLVEFIDSNGCFANDEITINVDILCDELFIPTGFSPNGDGINDFECVHGNCFREMFFIIYNRWGEKVFEANDPKTCWDGIYRGNICNEGVYTYYLEATTIKGQSYKKKGNITLVK